MSDMIVKIETKIIKKDMRCFHCKALLFKYAGVSFLMQEKDDRVDIIEIMCPKNDCKVINILALNNI